MIASLASGNDMRMGENEVTYYTIRFVVDRAVEKYMQGTKINWVWVS